MEPIYKKGKFLINEVHQTQIHKDTISFWNLGQAGILLKGRQEDGMICIDPYLTRSIEEADPDTEFKRAFAPILAPELLKGVNGVLITHEHDDHLDFSTLKEIESVSKETRISVPAPLVSRVSKELKKVNIIPSRESDPFFIEGFKVIPVPAAHTKYETDLFGDHAALGYFIEVNGIRLFHSGDTLVTPSLIEKVKEFKPHVAFLPINGGDYFRSSRGIIGNMSFREVADFSVAVGVDLIVPIHYDMFPNNRENPAYFVDYLFHHHPNQKFHMMIPGERFIYHK